MAIDTNVIVSAVLLPRSVPRQAVDRALEHGQILLSAAVVAELDEVLRRPRLNRYVTEEERLRFLSALIWESELVFITEAVMACRDPKDDMFLELAVNGRATLIISGDDDLLTLHPFRGVAILTPKFFLEATEPGPTNGPR